MNSTEPIDVTPSSGNVFADLGLPDAEELYAKSLLSILIARAIRDRGLTQTDAAALLGTTQPEISELVRGRLSGFSIERLFRFLNALGMNVRIHVTEAESKEEPAQTLVEARGSREQLQRILDRVPHVPPDPGDEL
jgi:predicted XRE-type DNA-binding protein